jgi:hypothetical protein
MALSILCLAGLSTFPTWRKERNVRTGSFVDIKPFPDRAVTRLCIAASALASALALIAALWQHIAAACAVAVIGAATEGYVVGHVGTSAVALVWLSFSTTAVATMGAYLIAARYRALDRLTDDD